MHDRTEPSAAELRQLLAAVLEAIALPHPVTVADAEVHDRLLLDRVLDVRVVLEGALEGGDDLTWSTDYLRARIHRRPATGYLTLGRLLSAVDDDRAAVRRSADRAERGEGQ